MGSGVSSITTEVRMSRQNVMELELRSNFRLSDFIKLQKVLLDGNRLTRIPYPIAHQIGSAPRLVDSLKELHLNNNNLTTLPSQICLLVNLKRLRLDNNLLPTIPAGFHALYKLEKLTLHNNNISVLPANLGNLKKLKILRLHNNQLAYIPNDIGALRDNGGCLKELTIVQNPLPEQVLQLNTLDSVLEWIFQQEVPEDYKQEYIRIKKNAHKDLSAKHEEARLFNECLMIKETRDLFYQFLLTEHSSGNLLFWERIQTFKNKFSSDSAITSNKLVSEATQIFEHYYTGDTINVPAQTLKKVQDLFLDSYKFPDGINQWIFNETQESIFKLMFTDSYKRWKVKAGKLHVDKLRKMLKQC